MNIIQVSYNEAFLCHIRERIRGCQKCGDCHLVAPRCDDRSECRCQIVTTYKCAKIRDVQCVVCVTFDPATCFSLPHPSDQSLHLPLPLLALFLAGEHGPRWCKSMFPTNWGHDCVRGHLANYAEVRLVDNTRAFAVQLPFQSCECRRTQTLLFGSDIVTTYIGLYAFCAYVAVHFGISVDARKLRFTTCKQSGRVCILGGLPMEFDVCVIRRFHAEAEKAIELLRMCLAWSKQSNLVKVEHKKHALAKLEPDTCRYKQLSRALRLSSVLPPMEDALDNAMRIDAKVGRTWQSSILQRVISHYEGEFVRKCGEKTRGGEKTAKFRRVEIVEFHATSYCPHGAGRCAFKMPQSKNLKAHQMFCGEAKSVADIFKIGTSHEFYGEACEQISRMARFSSNLSVIVQQNSDSTAYAALTSLLSGIIKT
jgi:hypothetical protein